MKFLCLICAEKVMEQMPEADAERRFEEYRKFTEAIRKSGHFIGVNRLEMASKRAPATDKASPAYALYRKCVNWEAGEVLFDERLLGSSLWRPYKPSITRQLSRRVNASSMNSKLSGAALP